VHIPLLNVASEHAREDAERDLLSPRSDGSEALTRTGHVASPV